MSLRLAAAARLAALLPPLALAACATSNTVCRTELPLEERAHLMLAQVSVNGTPVPGIFDTGAQTLAVTETLVTRLGLLSDPRNGSLMSGVGGEGIPQNDAAVDHFTLAGFDPGQGHLPVIPALVKGPGAPLGALIGADVISHFDVDLDVAHHRAVLYDPDRCQGPLPDWKTPVVVVPLDINWSGRLLLPVKLDGHKLVALLDSGATSSVVDLPAAEKLGVSGDILAREQSHEGYGAAGVNFQNVLHRFRSLEIGGERFDKPNLLVLDRPLRETDMLLGLDWLRIHRVWISYRQRKLFIARPTAIASASGG